MPHATHMYCVLALGAALVASLAAGARMLCGAQGAAAGAGAWREAGRDPLPFLQRRALTGEIS